MYRAACDGPTATLQTPPPPNLRCGRRRCGQQRRHTALLNTEWLASGVSSRVAWTAWAHKAQGLTGSHSCGSRAQCWCGSRAPGGPRRVAQGGTWSLLGRPLLVVASNFCSQKMLPFVRRAHMARAQTSEKTETKKMKMKKETAWRPHRLRCMIVPGRDTRDLFKSCCSFAKS